MANYEKRITVQIPHNMRMVLGILADSMGISISTYCRGILENFARGFGADSHIPSIYGNVPNSAAWKRAAVAWKTKGPDAVITIRMTNKVLEELDIASVYNRSSLIRSLILSHIHRFMPKLCIDMAIEQAEALKNVIKTICALFKKRNLSFLDHEKTDSPDFKGNP